MLLFACFFLSGFAALLYQTAWTRELSFVFGTSELAVAAVLAAYMAGLASGAAIAARWANRLANPILVYGFLEFGIALGALLVPLGIRGIGAVYIALFGGNATFPASDSGATTAFQLLATFLVLLPPTALMGATLPLLARHTVQRDEDVARKVGTLYAINTVGAITGTLLAAFWLIPEWGLQRSIWVGVATNLLVFGLAALLVRNPRDSAQPETTEPPSVVDARETHWILPAIAASGVVSFTLEVTWTRLLGHILGGSLPAFATMLASFLLGIALGSTLAARLAIDRRRATIGFAWAQIGIAVTCYSAFGLAGPLALLSGRLGTGPDSPVTSAAIAIAVMLPITFAIGTTFPFAVRIATSHPEATGRATARVYAWNTLGAITGSIASGYFLLPGLGFHGTVGLCIAVSLFLALAASLAIRPRMARVPPMAAVAATAILLVLFPARPPWKLLRSTPLHAGAPVAGRIVYSAVGRSSSVLLLDQGTHFRLTSNGLPEAGIRKAGGLPTTRTAFWLGALPSLLRPGTNDLLMIGFGGGVALELIPSSVERIDVIEIEPEIIAANRAIADQRAHDPLSDSRIRIHLGDARGTLRLVEKRFDAIVSQPSHPWTAGASHLYTREFFELVRSRLAPGGVFVQWIGLRFVDDALFESLLSTLLEVFPEVELYRPEAGGLLFAASDEAIDGIRGCRESLRRNPGDLARLGIRRVADFASAWSLGSDGARALAKGASANTDDHNRLATIAASLGHRSLDPETLTKRIESHDPLRDLEVPDRIELIRSVARRRSVERARALAELESGPDHEIALGWVELEAGQHARATRHFEKALADAPESREAVSGLVLSRKARWTTTLDIPPPFRSRMGPIQSALVEGWQHASVENWDAVRKLDSRLARARPGNPLFESATRLRIRMRLAAGEDRAAADEARTLSEELLVRHWNPHDELLRARAAVRAERPEIAYRSLQVLSARRKTSTNPGALGEQILEIARKLPPAERTAIRMRLAPGVSNPP